MTTTAKTKREPTEFEKRCVPYRGELMEFARRLCAGDVSRAEDVLQDSMMKAMEAWDRFTPEGDPDACVRGWLYRIVNNTYIKDYHHRAVRRDAAHLNRCEIAALTHGAVPIAESRGQGNRSSARQFEQGHRDRQVVWTSADPPGAFARDGASSAVPGEESYGDEVRVAIARLDPGQRAVVERYYDRGMSVEEIAADLVVALGTVRSRLARARAALGKTLVDFARAEYGIGRDYVAPPPEHANPSQEQLAGRAGRTRRYRERLARRGAREDAQSLEATDGPQADASAELEDVVGGAA